MNVTLIDEPPAEARRRLKAYRKAIHRKVDAEYVATEKAYRELALGRPLLNLAEALVQAPVDEKGRPRIAIARADHKQVYLTSAWQADRIVYDVRWNSRNGRLTRLELTMPGRQPNLQGWALVPMVPPEVKKHHALAKCHVLWEVEAWADQRIGARSDVDPLLLRFLGGDLWAVLGEWELTPLERAIMQGRATQ